MTMYRCNNCGHLFEEGEQDKWVENHGFFLGNGEEFTGCPICHGSYEEVKLCNICDTMCETKQDEYCNGCKKEIRERFENLMDSNFDEEERKLLNILYEGELL